MDQKETHKCFSSNHVWKTDIEAPLLDLMAEQTESASGEGFRLFRAVTCYARAAPSPHFVCNVDVCAAKINN